MGVPAEMVREGRVSLHRVQAQRPAGPERRETSHVPRRRELSLRSVPLIDRLTRRISIQLLVQQMGALAFASIRTGSHSITVLSDCTVLSLEGPRPFVHTG